MINHQDTCRVHCTDNDKTVEAEVMQFTLKDTLVVVLATNKIVMKYKQNADIYVGNLMGMEFTSQGPSYYETKGRY